MTIHKDVLMYGDKEVVVWSAMLDPVNMFEDALEVKYSRIRISGEFSDVKSITIPRKDYSTDFQHTGRRVFLYWGKAA